MTEVETSLLLNKFKQTAAELNQASNEINSIISSYEAQLAEANAGVEHWLESESDALCPSTPDESSNEPGVLVETHKAHQLGFAKLNVFWKLVIRQVNAERRHYAGIDEYIARPIEGSMSELSKASREIRIAALGKFPNLIEEMHREAVSALETITRAKRLVR
ncbi:MAG: hypothetical protein Q7S58_16250 [Candidatus Binatus sp.]|uniref:hypothetical protein n=1 Tax=Candidatus Binatus sp. TaxID=2811406 RepID=UPI00271F7412|nr:hypothetical protein [Candidatus Binatus sp.]MDO8433951.1 hypothetical protein [Candidatus Binatus sp.]